MLFNLVISFYNVIISVNILLLYSILMHYHIVSATELRIREDSKLFVRLNLKINTVEYSKIFAYAIGYRVNFDLRKSKKSKELTFHNGVSTYFHPEQIRKVTEYLFNAYGWNGTSCLVRTMCEISHIPEYSYDLIGPLMKLAFTGSVKPRLTKIFCQDAINCPISVLHLLTHDEF